MLSWRLAEIYFFEDIETVLNIIYQELNFILGYLNATAGLEGFYTYTVHLCGQSCETGLMAVVSFGLFPRKQTN